jgi:hypothetical protein
MSAVVAAAVAAAAAKAAAAPAATTTAAPAVAAAHIQQTHRWQHTSCTAGSAVASINATHTGMVIACRAQFNWHRKACDALADEFHLTIICRDDIAFTVYILRVIMSQAHPCSSET